MKKQALGKGLKAFLADDYGILKEERYAEIDIELITPNPMQPRQTFDPDTLNELAQSISKSGILQPILVVPEDERYKIIVGERRWRAAQKAGLKKIPALIRSMEAATQIEASLIENIQRDDLNPLDIAHAYQTMIKTLDYTQAQVAEKVGKDRASVANYIRLLQLPQEVQYCLANRSLSMGHARALLSLEDPEVQKSIAEQIVKKNLSVREVEQTVKNFKPTPPTKTKQEPSPDMQAFEEELIKALGTKISISGTNHKGIIKIHYYSLEDLNRIYEKIKGDWNER